MECPLACYKEGRVSGVPLQLESEDANTVFCYRNIPFAKPPTGDLRFMAPEPPDPWQGVRDGTVLCKIPFQPLESPKYQEKYFPMKRSPGENEDMSEDCLHLTVYTTSLNKKLPVMVWFYGGSFQDGSEKLYDGSALAGLNDVVVVIPNYRLNVFGFLSLGQNSPCPGNAGLLDQRMALKWVQENIHAFGGDAENVTIFGESAGGMAVNHHVNSFQSRGLFHRAISHSGQANSSVYFTENPTEGKKQLLEYFKIKETNDRKILELLQNIPAQELHEANVILGKDELLFLPCVDGNFLVKTPDESLHDRDFADVPYMIGCNNSEGDGIMSAGIGGRNFEQGKFNEKDFTENSYFCIDEGDIPRWMEFYKEKILFKLYGRVMGDVMFVVPAITTALAHADKHDVYFYYGTFQLRFQHDDEYGTKEARKPPWCFCDHGDDVYMMLGIPLTNGNLRCEAKFSKAEKKLCRVCMQYITNFARNGNPNSDGNKAWPKYKKEGNYLIIDHVLSSGTRLKEQEVDYWINYARGK